MIALGRLLLAAGFLAGALVTVREEARVAWGPYAGCAGAMVLGLVLLRRATSSGEVREKATESVAVLERTVEALCAKLAALASSFTDAEVRELPQRLDAELLEDLGLFAEHREGLIRRFDLTTYADVMSAFAQSERYVNRAWSAAADGYVDEVRRSLEIARGEMEAARAKLGAAAARVG